MLRAESVQVRVDGIRVRQMQNGRGLVLAMRQFDLGSRTNQPHIGFWCGDQVEEAAYPGNRSFKRVSSVKWRRIADIETIQ
nr:hypothetical protein [Pseudaminobacter salicylatoxidans]